jgi:hypothetical protein
MTSCVLCGLTSKISHYYDLAAGNSKDRVNTRCWLVTAVVVGVAVIVITGSPEWIFVRKAL